MTGLSPALAAAVTARLGAAPTAATPLSGGDTHAVLRLDTPQGPVVLKTGAHAPDQFEREADGLRALAASGSPLAVPTPLHAARPEGDTPAYLLLSYLPPGAPAADTDARTGAGLAALHRATAPAFGFAADTFCGPTRQPNGWLDDWPRFYRDRRLAPLLRLAVDGRGVPPSEHRACQRLLDHLDDHLAADPEPPALIHGDLWRGNLHLTTGGAPALIDPAASYSHREAELGMMGLFGGFSPTVYAAYHAAYPLQPGWRDRQPLYRLYHLLNHYILFGGHYGAEAWAIAWRYGGRP